jgi:hypothetical protein
MDESRPSVLCGFASAKHERLLELIGQFDYARIEIAAPPGGKPRNRLAQIVAQVAVGRSKSAELHEVSTGDIEATLRYLGKCYKAWYLDQGFNFEVGLTGSKIQAAGCAVFSSAMKVAQAWYVGPKKFDKKRFTAGVGETTVVEVSLRK